MSDSSTAAASMTGEKKTSRQRPGAACEECRRRKLSCDRKQPSCTACYEAGVHCVNDNTLNVRGPKRGHLKALQNRMALLEKRLLEQQTAGVAPVTTMNMDLSDLTTLDSFLTMDEAALPSPPMGTSPENSTSTSGLQMDILQEFRISNSAVEAAPMFNCNFYVSDMLRTDFDQLYFERVHPSVPILHQRQYFSWSRNITKTESQTCLQYAMWTLAASLSSQLSHTRDGLYETTRRMLEASEPSDDITEFSDIEHIQARILLLIYEFMRTNYQRGWISAGRCFRLLQLMRLYEIDTPEQLTKRNSELDPEEWITTESKRRTFWMAYSLDRFISIRGEFPLTLNEQVICTRLPITEEEYQEGKHMDMPFLSEAMISVDQNSKLSPFTESIILATICGRALAHRQQTTVERAYINIPQHFWDRHEWLDTMLRTRMEILQQSCTLTPQNSGSMLLFTNMLAHTTVLYLCKVMDSMSWETSAYRNAIVEFKQRALLAAQEIVNLSRSLAHLSYFKAHPFTPLPLVLCADFFNTHRYLTENVDIHVQEIVEVLKDITSVNNLAQDYFHQQQVSYHISTWPLEEMDCALKL